MEQYFVLTNRKRAIIALVHSVFFLLVAIWAFVPPLKPAADLVPGHDRFASSVTALAIYAVVSLVLVWLMVMSRCTRERLYFALCSSSALAGLGRVYLGDAMLPGARWIRVTMLLAAVLVGVMILKAHSEIAVAAD